MFNCGRLEKHGMTYDSYAQSTLRQDMLTMPMLRICEIAKLYRTDLEALYPDYDWKPVGAMRQRASSDDNVYRLPIHG